MLRPVPSKCVPIH